MVKMSHFSRIIVPYAGGAEINNSLHRGLRQEITGRSRPSDPDYEETRRADILRGNQAMTLSHKAEDGRPRRGHNKGMHRNETNGARGATTPATLRSRRMRSTTWPSANAGTASTPKTTDPGHAAAMAGESERAETP